MTLSQVPSGGFQFNPPASEALEKRNAPEPQPKEIMEGIARALNAPFLVEKRGNGTSILEEIWNAGSEEEQIKRRNDLHLWFNQLTNRQARMLLRTEIEEGWEQGDTRTPNEEWAKSVRGILAVRREILTAILEEKRKEQEKEEKERQTRNPQNTEQPHEKITALERRIAELEKTVFAEPPEAGEKRRRRESLYYGNNPYLPYFEKIDGGKNDFKDIQTVLDFYGSDPPTNDERILRSRVQRIGEGIRIIEAMDPIGREMYIANKGRTSILATPVRLAILGVAGVMGMLGLVRTAGKLWEGKDLEVSDSITALWGGIAAAAAGVKFTDRKSVV